MSDVKNPSFTVSIIPIIAIGIFLGLSIFVYDAEPHMALFLGGTVAVIVALALGNSWKSIEDGITDAIKTAIPALIIMLIIGMIIGIWIASGVVPGLIYYSFDFMIPSLFLPAVLVFCSVVAIVTGSSWTTAGTAGVACIAIGQGMGVPVEAIAGAVVSGSFFGDKLSPLSDSTNLKPSIVGVELYEHIKHMLYTTLPAFLVGLVFFFVLGMWMTSGQNSNGDIYELQSLLGETFVFSPWLILPPAAVITMILFRMPAIPSLIVGVILGSIMYVSVQGANMNDMLQTLYGGYSIDTGSETMDNILSQGGMSDMYSIIALAMIALGFGGVMNKCGMLHSIVTGMMRFVRSTGNLVSTTLTSGIFINIFSANQYLAVIIPGQMFKESFEKKNLHQKNLSRAMEGSGTLTAPLIPWNSSGMFMLSVLSVSPVAFAPYAIVCWLTPIIVAAYGYLNITMDTDKENKKEEVS
ncbi:Na+/H+ antiporter NhaC [Evansella tamaricis]|uniref:Na+/H+ antiporter NhaC n=1 Tax=Evansella tamaricis TaxID=2069301 RepID=A0ABS6JI29_9BACI|nr:Na+/H+ antiporter NhaC [Evansella tamaricis]MBU9713040.1 Na+/H+ antiporter NhaC [Evansella tamaricis]